MCISSPCATPLAPKEAESLHVQNIVLLDGNQPISHAALKELLKTWKKNSGCGLFGHLTALTAGNNSYQPHNLFESLHAHMKLKDFSGSKVQIQSNN